MTPFPRQPEALTPEWLTSALLDAGHLDEATSVAALSWAPIGDGYAATTVRIVPTYEGPADSAPASFAAKFARDYEGPLELARAFRFYERESRFYSEVAVGDRGVGVRIPRAFVNEFDYETHEFVLLLEDLTDADPGDHVAGTPAEQLPTIMRQYARMHAHWWNTSDVEQYEFLSLPRQALLLIEAIVQQSAVQAGGLIDEYLPAALRERFEQAAAHLVGNLEFFRLGPVRTLLHGDAHIANLMFPSDGSDPYFLDWQLATVGHGIDDVARFLMLSVDPEVRRRHTDEAIAASSDELAARSVHLPVEECHRLLPAATLMHIGQLAIAGDNLDTSGEQAEATMGALIGRVSAALEEIEDVDAAIALSRT